MNEEFHVTHTSMTQGCLIDQHARNLIKVSHLIEMFYRQHQKRMKFHKKLFFDQYLTPF